MTTSKKKCRFCDKFGRTEEMRKVPLGYIHDTDKCIMGLATDKREKTVKARKQVISRRHRAEKKQHRANDLPHQLDMTRRRFNEMIRELDRGKRCPTCDNQLEDGYYDAGHVRTVASCGALRFDARNCFGQCTGCNGTGLYRKKTKQTQETVIERYKTWVLNTLGQAHYDWLYGPHASPKWTCDDLAAMRAVFAEETRRLQREEPPSRDWRAIPA